MSAISKMTAAVTVLLALTSGAWGEVVLGGGRISTWSEGETRYYSVEGGAWVRSGETEVSGDSMYVVVETGAEGGGGEEIFVYFLKDGDGMTLRLTGKGELKVEGEVEEVGESPRNEAVMRGEAAHRGGMRGTPPAPPEGDEAATANDEEVVVITYSPIDSDKFTSEVQEVEGRVRVIVTGGVEIAFDEFTMRAENMVVWKGKEKKGEEEEKKKEKEKDFQIYAEEEVRFTTPAARLEARRVYYDNKTRKATLVDAEVRREIGRGIPLIIRAAKMRMLSGERFEAERAYVTTCEFGRPHYRVEARKVEATPGAGGDGGESVLLVAEGNRLYAGEVPVFRWGRISRDMRGTQIPLRRIGVGNSGDFGNYLYTRWDLLDFLAGSSRDSWAAGVSEWGDLTADVDYRSKRGVGGGLNFAYDTPEARGELSGYYIKDRGTDANGYAPERDDRGRVKWQQRVMADEVQVDTELSYISDRGFLREYYEKEAKEGKEQESLIYIKRQWDRAQASGIYRSRLNDWQSQTEYLPEGRFDVVGYGLWGGAVLYNQTTRAGNVRWRPDWMVGAASYQTQRADTWHEIEAPFNAGMGGLSVTPFATARETWYADGVNGEEASRYAGSWGTKVSLPPVWRVWGAENALLDVHGLRHVAALDFTYESVYDSTRRPGEVLQFDEVDMVDTLEVATVRLRQRLQTKRERAEEGRMRTVDLASIETEADYFARPGRDNMGKVWSDVRYYGRFAITDDVSVVADGEYDTYGGEFAKAGAWLLVDHSPRTRWSVGTRYVRDTSASAVTIRLDQSITDRWDVALLGQFDTDRGEVLDETVVLRRNLHRFALEILVDYDRGRDETSVGVAFYPLGLGGRRMFY